MKNLFLTKNEKGTIQVGKKIGKKLKRGDILSLVGELGSGKTIFVKGIGEALGIPPQLINSPSFVLIREYPGKLNLFHFDLYRLNRLEEFTMIGWEEYLDKQGIIVIEWGEKIEGFLPPDYLRIEFEIVGDKKRRIRLLPKGKRFRELIKYL